MDRVRRQVTKFDDPALAKTFGTKPNQTVIQSCLACDNTIDNQTEVCCYGLYKDKPGGLQWRCSSSKPNKIGISRSTNKYIKDRAGNIFTRGSGSANDICMALGERVHGERGISPEGEVLTAWQGARMNFPDLTRNDNACKAATKICKA